MSGARQISASTVRLTAEQEPFLAVRSLATNYSSGYRIESHQHPWHQLLYATSGAMTVSTSESSKELAQNGARHDTVPVPSGGARRTLCASWMIPTGRAVFIPAACAHAIRMWGTVEMRTLYLCPALTAFENIECRVVEVAPLLRELILRTVERIGLDCRAAHDSRMIG